MFRTGRYATRRVHLRDVPLTTCVGSGQRLRKFHGPYPGRLLNLQASEIGQTCDEDYILQIRRVVRDLDRHQAKVKELSQELRRYRDELREDEV